jgi:hypothetical protein
MHKTQQPPLQPSTREARKQPLKQPSAEQDSDDRSDPETRLEGNPPKQPVAVLMAVRFQFFCFWVRRIAI